MGSAIRYNFFIFKEKIKKISTSIRAKGKDITSLQLLKTGAHRQKLETTSSCINSIYFQ
jgi:hypothetical protein